MQTVEVVMYHYVRDLKNSRYPNIKGLDLSLFKRQIAYFENNYSFIGVNDILSACYEGKKLPKNPIMLSFDDGYIDHYTNVFPILAAKGIPGLFAMPGKIIEEKKVLDVNKIHYILASANIEEIIHTLANELDRCRAEGFAIPNYAELYSEYAVASRFDPAEVIFVKRVLQNAIEEDARNIIVDRMFKKYVSDNEAAFVSELYLSMDQIEVMKKYNMTFGLHGYEHYWFNKLDEETFKKDISRALGVFENVIDQNNWAFVYPYGATQPMLLDYCRSINCKAGFTVEPRVADLDVVDPLVIPRFDTNDYPPVRSV